MRERIKCIVYIGKQGEHKERVKFKEINPKNTKEANGKFL